jgi:predicted permease
MPFTSLLSDLRHGARTLRLNPVFAVSALATLTIGIGGTVALFSVVRSVLLDPPGYADPTHVVHLYETREDGSDRANMSYPDVMDVRDRAAALSGVSARQSWSPTLTGTGTPARLDGASVNANYFNVLGVPAVLGRVFDEGDGVAGHPPVVIVSHRLWGERFGRDVEIIGRTLDLSGLPYEIIGVLPADFEDTEGTLDVWRADPSYFDVTQLSRTGHSFRPMARIAPGYSIDQVNAELSRINADLVREYPEKTGDGMIAVPVMDVLVGDGRDAIIMLFASVSVLLLIACTNVANLLLGRADARRREMAIRTAMGASPRRLVEQLVIESLLLAFLGGGAGLLLAVIAVPGFVGMTTAIPRADQITIDPTVIGFAVVVTALAGLVFGLAPAVLTSRRAPAAHLRDGVRTLDAGGRWSTRTSLVIGELALSVVLLSSAGLLARSLLALQSVDKGVRTENILTLNLTPSSDNRPEHSDLTRYWQEVIARLSAIPGVRSAAAVSFLPMSGGYEGQGIRRMDRPEPEPGQAPGAEARAVTPDYFRTMGISVLRGRGFTAADDSAAPLVAVINQTLAASLFPGEDPLGKRIEVQRTAPEVIGIVTDVRQFGVQAEVRPEIYAPHAQPFVPWIRRSMDLVVHTERDAESLASPVREAVWSVDPTAPIASMRTMERWVADDISAPRFRTLLVGAFAVYALLLALIGIGGVLSYSVARRTREFGLRAAIGATSTDVLRMVLAQGARIIAIGVGIGLAGSLLAARILRGILFQVSPSDPLTMAVVTGTVVLVAFAAMLVPAARAARVSPVIAMRTE